MSTSLRKSCRKNSFASPDIYAILFHMLLPYKSLIFAVVIKLHWHILIWTACCNTCWLKACVANWSWRIWEWLLMGYNADHTHLSSNMSHDLHSLLCISVGRCCWSDFVYFKVTQYINPSKPSSRYFRCKINVDLFIAYIFVSCELRKAKR